MNPTKLNDVKEDFNKKSVQFEKDLGELSDNISEISASLEEKIQFIDNAHNEIKVIDKDFAKRTSIYNKKDQIFLWIAVSLQTIRQFLQPKLQFDLDKPDTGNRIKAKTSEEKKILKNKRDSLVDDYGDSKYIKKLDYYLRPVPYDAMHGLGAKGTILDGVKKNPDAQLYGGNHHAATLGHDPVLGYFFGTLNIMTSTITFHKADLQTNTVLLDINSWNQTILGRVSFFETLLDAVSAEYEDYLRVPFAVGRQAIHISTDKDTKCGLPIPFLPAKEQQKLLAKGWNSEEVRKVFKSFEKYKNENLTTIAVQFMLSALINIVISTLHLLLYDEGKDGPLNLYKVRTHRILEVSNCISSSINFGFFVGNMIGAIFTENVELAQNAIKHLDVGGYIETVHQIVSSEKLQEQMRREYLEKELYKKIVGPEYTFLKEEADE